MFNQLLSTRTQRLGREFFWVGLGQTLTALGAIVGVRLLTGVMSPEVYGELALGLTAVALITQFLTGPLSNAAARFFAPAHESGEFSSYAGAFRGLLVRASGVVLLLAGATCLVLQLTGQSALIWLAIAAFTFALLSGLSAVLSSLQNAARQRAVVAWHQVLATWSRFLIAAGLVVLLGDQSVWAMAGFALAAALVLASQFIFYRRLAGALADEAGDLASGEIAHRYRTKVLSYAWPFVVTAIFVFAQESVDKWALQWFASTEDVGYYAALYQIGFAPIALAGGLLGQLFLPIYFGRIGDAQDPSRVRRANSLNTKLLVSTLLITVLAASVAAVAHAQIFSVFVGPEYRSVSWLLPLVVLCGGVAVAIQWASLYQMGQLKTQRLVIPNIVGNCIGVVLLLIGAYGGGLLGVVCAKLLFLVIQLALFLSLNIKCPDHQLRDAELGIMRQKS